MANLEKVEQELNGGWVRTVKDLFAGASGGITQVLLGEFCATHFRYVLFQSLMLLLTPVLLVFNWQTYQCQSLSYIRALII